MVVMSCRVGCRHGSDLALLLLWHRQEAAASIQNQAWELMFAAYVALKKKRGDTERKGIKMLIWLFWGVEIIDDY